jgi:GTP-binding protein
VDVNVPPQQSDQQLFQFLAANGRPFLVVATKADRLSGNELRKSLDALSSQHPGARVLPFSAKKGTGREELWQEIRDAAQRNLPAAHQQHSN